VGSKDLDYRGLQSALSLGSQASPACLHHGAIGVAYRTNSYRLERGWQLDSSNPSELRKQLQLSFSFSQANLGCIDIFFPAPNHL
jgi:hypothetical protein